MAADKIQYADKVSIDPKPNPVNQLWRYLDANEVKQVVNAHADEIDDNNDDITYINQNIINTTSIENADFTLNNGDEGTMFICNKGTEQIVTVNTALVGAIPIGSTVYFIQTGAGKLVINGSNVTVYGNNNGTAGMFEIELKFGVVALNHYAEDNYIVSGNLLIG